MGIAGFGSTQLRYDMFELARSAEEAKRLHKCGTIYHRGQELAWDGRDVLAELIAKHGGVHVAGEHRAALERIFTVILWGELAAWKISAQLADRLVPLEPKMAATSQAFDEARHFYVLHDYLSLLGASQPPPDKHTQAAIALVVGTRSLPQKLLGMQLLLEPMALTIFHVLRHLEIEPVLCELLEYYERDEARHVGLGIQALPHMLVRMRKDEGVRLIVVQLRMFYHVLRSMKTTQPCIEAIGADAREILDLGAAKQEVAVRMLFEEMGISNRKPRDVVQRIVGAAAMVAFPKAGEGTMDRLRAAAGVLRNGLSVENVPLTEVC